ncbi:hypothetical protein [Porcincola intestinalis]|uniref:hypothetical protein n=1 Tax=Porcincola intestinalis TaxID=2606632 RepID=UPI002A90B685|nr:hypothetical protein [Porcincola intestinalis]MDY5579987.1 hypothetical protein [Porcincola intestinalis]
MSGNPIRQKDGQETGYLAKKEMPAENEDVLLSGIRRSADVGYYDGDAEAFFCYISGDLQYPVAEVKAWMPLPEPYKENENVEER